MNNETLQKHQLLVLHIIGWLIYIVTDHVDHVDHLVYGSNHFFPSMTSGLVAWLLTGSLALLFLRMKKNTLAVKVIFFVFLLFVFAVLWQNFFKIMHGYISVQELLSYNIRQWLSGVSFAIYLFAGWAGLFLGAQYFIALREKQQLLMQALLAAKQAQLQSLRYQLNPHVLFNILNSIDVSVLAKDNDTAHLMLTHLSQFMRNSLQYTNHANIPLKHEINMLNDFIAIEQIRFGTNVNIEFCVEPVCETALIPPMLLQPLIENAIKFAWHKHEKGEVKLEVTKHNNSLNIALSNSKLTDVNVSEGTGTGLKNTRERLEASYGEDAELVIENTATHFVVKLQLPWVNTL